MQTIAIVNEKGGTGKTTTAVCLSAALGRLGAKVLLVDLDGQAASSRWLGVEEDSSFADALWRGEGLRPIPDVAPGVSLAPGSGKLDSVAHDLRPTQGGQLRKLLSESSAFDYVLIDCPPSLGNRLIGNALLAASDAIVPVETSVLALDGLKILLTTLGDVRDGFGHDIQLMGVLACRYDARTRLSRLILAELQRALPGKVFHTVIRENVRVRECPGSGQVIFDYAPDSHAAEDYLALGREVLAVQECRGQPGMAPPQAQAGALTEQERLAVDGLRKNVDALLQESKPGAADKPSCPDTEPQPVSPHQAARPEELDPVEPKHDEEAPLQPLSTKAESFASAGREADTDASEQAEDAAQTEQLPKPWTPELAALARQAQPTETGASVFDEAEGEPAGDEAIAIEPSSSEPPQDELREDTSPEPALVGRAPAPVERSERLTEKPWEKPALADRAAADGSVGAPSALPSQPVEPSVGPVDGQRDPEVAQGGDFPALRAALKRIIPKEPEGPPGTDEEPSPARENRNLWRRLMRKPRARELAATAAPGAEE